MSCQGNRRTQRRFTLGVGHSCAVLSRINEAHILGASLFIDIPRYDHALNRGQIGGRKSVESCAGEHERFVPVKRYQSAITMGFLSEVHVAGRITRYLHPVHFVAVTETFNAVECGLLIGRNSVHHGPSTTDRVAVQRALAGTIGMVVKYGPGSLVTRRRPALAISRLIAPYQVPVVVVTNGEGAEIIDGLTGKVTALGLDSIPGKPDLRFRMAHYKPVTIPEERIEMEERIVYAFEVDDSCPCDDTICRL